jgi:peptidoglycan hydrolase CwlO-like protein
MRALEDQERDRHELADASEQLVEAKSRLLDASNRLAAARQALTERQAGVPQSLRTQKSLEAAIQNASARLEALTKAYEAARTQVEETAVKPLAVPKSQPAVNCSEVT